MLAIRLEWADRASFSVRDMYSTQAGAETGAASREAVEALAGYLENDDEAVQARAVSLLDRVDGAALAPYVGLILSDPSRAAFQLLNKLGRAELQAYSGAADKLVSLLEKRVMATAEPLNKFSSEALGQVSEPILKLFLDHKDRVFRGVCDVASNLALKLPPSSIDERFTAELERLRGPLLLLDATGNRDRAPGGSVGESAAPDASPGTMVPMEVSPPKGADDAEPPSASADKVPYPTTRSRPLQTSCVSLSLSLSRRPCVCVHR